MKRLLGLSLSALLALSLPVAAQPVEQPLLRWGGDQSGGGPYIYEKNGQLVGFEVELANALARHLGRTPQFIQGDWDKLPELLTSRRDIDCILNGYEWSPRHARSMVPTIPYYLFRIVLQVRKDDASLRGWDDLRSLGGQPKRVGVLTGSIAEQYLRARFGDQIELRMYKDVTNVMDLVQRKQDLDAYVQDEPAARFYAADFPGLHTVGEPIEAGTYVLYVRPNDLQLREQLNTALRQLIDDGTVRRIYEPYGLWNNSQERLERLAHGPWPPEQDEVTESLGTTLRRHAWSLTKAAGVTVVLACLAMPCAIVIGLVVAVGRLYGPRWLAVPLAGYVEVLRGTPLLFQLYMLYFLLPSAGVRIPAFWAGVLGLAINYSAYEAENYRAGLLAIPRGQLEAALALGMSTWTALRRVVVPQALRLVVPPVTNDFIALFKDTSVCSVIAVTELAGRYSQLYNTDRQLIVELTALTAMLYLLMSYPLSLLARRLERQHEGT